MNGRYVDVAGHPTWVEEEGHGGAVVLLHGGLSNSSDLAGLASAVAVGHRAVAFDRRGHGRTADVDAPFSYDAMAEETVHVLEDVVGQPAHLVGWSDGGIVALFVALARPDLVRTLVTMGVNYRADALESDFIEPDDPILDELAQSYGEQSPDGAAHWPEVLVKTLTLWRTEPNLTEADLGHVTVPVLVMAGDDEPIPLGHTCSLYESLPAGQLAVVPGTSHVFPLEKPDVVNRLVLDFVDATGPPSTFMPVRRR